MLLLVFRLRCTKDEATLKIVPVQCVAGIDLVHGPLDRKSTPKLPLQGGAEGHRRYAS